jgi:hypothetical protein
MTAAPLPIVLRPSPFKLETRQHVAVEGQSIADILRDFPDLPPEVWTHGVVHIGEWEIPRERWARVKPRASGTGSARYLVRVGIRPAGGRGSGGGKNPLATIAAIALVVVASAITGGAAAGLFGTTLFAAGSTSAALLAAGVSVVGALAINALAPPPSTGGKKQDDDKRASLGSASIQGNVLEAFAPIPFVIGQHRVSPPHLIPPWSESINDDQYVYAIVGLNGAHQIDDIRINGTPIDDMVDVEYEVRDVITNDAPVTLIDKQVFESQVGAELSPHKTQDDATATLQTTTNPAASYPIWVGSRSRSEPDEIWLSFTWTTLLMQDGSNTVSGGVGVRMRIRRAGDVSWINLPEFHAHRERLEPFRGMIKLRFAEVPSSFVRLDQDVTRPPWKLAIYATNTQNSESFDTDSYFAPVSGNNAANVTGEEGVAVVYLDPAVFTPGVYDVQVMRGYGYKAQDFTASTYRLSSNIPYFFSHTPSTSPPTIRQEQSKVPAKITFGSMSSVWNEPPLGETGLSLIAVKAKNVSVSALTTLATGYANTWDGVDWDTFEPTSNPAAWLRYLMLGGQSVRAPFVAGQLDEAGLQDFYDFCEGGGGEPAYQCNAYIEGTQALNEVMRLVAGCGRAAMRVSDRVGVVIERDRTGEAPIQLFTQRNTRGLSIRRAFPRVPDGFRIRFNDETNDYSPKEVFVYRRLIGGDPADVEAVTYIGVTNEGQAIDRGYLDLRQLLKRPALYNFETDISNIYCTKGSLVALVHDTVRRHNDGARVAEVLDDGTDVTGLVLDSKLRLTLAAQATDFEADALASPPDGWASQWDANVTALVTAQAGLPSGQGPLIDKTTSTGDSFFAWEDAEAATPADCEILALIRPNADSGTTDNAIGVVLRGSGDNSTKTGYRCCLNSATAGARNRVEISKWVGGSFTFLANATFAWVTGTNYWIRFRARGTSLRAKVWADGAAEPGSWMVTTTDSDITGFGKAGAYVFHPSSSFYLGSFAVQPLCGLVIQLRDGTTRTEELVETIDTDTVTFADPFPIPADITTPSGPVLALDVDCLVASGPFSSVEKRMLVLGVQPQSDLTAALTLVDEAPLEQWFSPSGDGWFATGGTDKWLAPF